MQLYSLDMKRDSAEIFIMLKQNYGGKWNLWLERVENCVRFRVEIIVISVEYLVQIWDVSESAYIGKTAKLRSLFFQSGTSKENWYKFYLEQPCKEMVVSTSKINMRYNEKLNISVPILACSAGAFVDRKTWRVVGQVGWVAGERERVWGRGGSPISFFLTPIPLAIFFSSSQPGLSPLRLFA